MDFDSLWDYNDSSDTEQRFRALLPTAEAAGDPEYLAQLLTQIARTQGLQARFQDAHATLDEAQRLIDSGKLRLASVRYLLERGRTFNSAGEQAKALPLFQEAYRVAEWLGEHRYAVDALHMIAIAERNPAEQVEWNLKAIALAERTNERGWLFALYNNIGESYLSLQQYSEAYDYFSRLAALQIERTGSADIYTVKDQAKAARLSGSPRRSLLLIRPVFDKICNVGSDDGYIRQELAEALYATGRAEEAKSHFAKAYEILSQDKWVAQYEAPALERMKELAA